MSDWVWWIVAVVVGVGVLFGAAVAGFSALVYAYARHRYTSQIVRIFEERPLFIVPRGKPIPGAEDLTLTRPDGPALKGCYLRSHGKRKGVVLFGLEFGSNRWSVAQYCGHLLDAGYDLFTYEPRNQGESEKDPTYTPLQWVTDRDMADARAAVAYLKSRPDAPKAGIGIFGISKGGGTGLLLAAEDRWVRCVATDGAYAAYTTMVPYMRRWVSIYSTKHRLQAMMPDWLYGLVGLACMATSARKRGVRFLSVEKAVRRMRSPLLMVHGGADTYIKPPMTETLFAKARPRAKSLWLVPGAKHNQALHVAGDEYHRRLVAFFDEHLAEKEPESGVNLTANPNAGTGGAAVAVAGS